MRTDRWSAVRHGSRRSVLVVLPLVLLLICAPGARAQGGNGGGGGGSEPPEEGLGNNLSSPVVFAEGMGVLGLPVSEDAGVRPRPGETNPTLPYFDPSSFYTLDGVKYYPQGTESTWQAQWEDGSGAPVSAIINWGDNLLARSWTTRSQIRVETGL